MPWQPPTLVPDVPLRQLLSQEAWATPIELIARRHGLWPCELAPYERGETIVWRAGSHVIKLTLPQCQYQIDAEVGCLGAVQGKLSVATPRLHAHGELAGWPYVVMERIGGQPLAAVWPALPSAERKQLAGALGQLCRELHALPPAGFPTGWSEFWQSCQQEALARHVEHGGPPALLAAIEPFLRKVGSLDASRLVPAHTELLDQHVYVESVAGRWRLSGLIDFADARLAPFEYEVCSPAEFIFKGERGLLREFLLAYGKTPEALTPRYAEQLLAWNLNARFPTLARLLAVVEPFRPASLEELAATLYTLES